MNPINLNPVLPQVPGYSWRPICLDDAEGIHRLLLDVETVDQREWVDTLEDRQRDFQDPSTNIETDSLVALTPDHQIVALGWIFAPHEVDQEYIAFLWGEVHPEHRQRGLGSAILAWMETRGRQILANRPADRPHYLRSWSQDNLKDRCELFESHGFSAARFSYRMRRDLSLPIPEPDLPAGIELIKWRTEDDTTALEVFNAAFHDHWGFIPVSHDIWELFYTGHPDFHSELSFMALARSTGNQPKVIGFSLNQIRSAQNQLYNINQGWIQDLAVLKEYRRQGIATALLCASMHVFKDAGLDYAGLGVDTENLTGALHLYEKLGFIPVKRSITYQIQV